MASSVTALFRENGWVVECPGRDELDVSDREGVRKWFSEREPFDFAVCNAGVTGDGLLARRSGKDWDDVIGVNLSGSAWCARYAAEGMKRIGKDGGRKGHIVFIGSYIAEHPRAGQALYASSKSALKGLVKSLAMEWGSTGIRVNLVYPGFMETKMTASLNGEARERALSGHVLGEFNTPCRVAEFLLFLQEKMPFTSGQLFSLDSRLI